MRYLDKPQVRLYALFVSFGLLIAYQAVTLMVGELGLSLVTDGFQPEISQRVITFPMFQDYLRQQNIVEVAGQTFLIALSLIVIQIVPLLLYVSRSRIQTKLYLAWGFFLGPGIITLPSGGGPIIYFLLAPIYALTWFPGFVMDGISYDTWTQGWDAQFTAIGWFNLFWCAIALFNLMRWHNHR